MRYELLRFYNGTQRGYFSLFENSKDNLKGIWKIFSHFFNIVYYFILSAHVYLIQQWSDFSNMDVVNQLA